MEKVLCYMFCNSVVVAKSDNITPLDIDVVHFFPSLSYLFGAVYTWLKNYFPPRHHYTI
jgi:hypothetical protein